MFLTSEKIINSDQKQQLQNKSLMCQCCNRISRGTQQEENATLSLNWVLVILGAAFAYEKNLQQFLCKIL